MKKYIKSILTSRKQLMLLPLMLVSGGIMQAQTAVPDTIYVSFNAADPVTMTYGQDMNTVVFDAGLTGSSFSYLYVKAEDGTASGLNGTVSFKDGATVASVLKFSATPTVGGGQALGFVADNLSDYFSYTANGENVVFFTSNRSDATITRTLTVNKATLSIAAKDTSRFYGDENPATPWSAKDFVFSGFVNDETEAIFTNSQVNVR